MNKVNNRYTNQELIKLLQIWCMDFNRKPTQRDILADERMPTHHTYINRFGTLKNALIQAGVFGIDNISILHNMVATLLQNKHIKYEEFIRFDKIIVDFVIELYGKTFIIDIINVDKFEISDGDKMSLLDYRIKCIESVDIQGIHTEYVAINNILDMHKIENLLL